VLGSLDFTWQLIDPSRLTIEPEGLTWGNSFSARRMQWQDLRAIRARSFLGFHHIACELRTKNNQWVPGVFPGGWESETRALVETLNRARTRWLRIRDWSNPD
jgi:hypothetical protein